MNNFSLYTLMSLCFLLNYNTLQGQNTELISVDQMHKLLMQDSVQLIDVRTAEEFYKGHIKNAQNIDFLSPDFDLKMAVLDNSKPLILYCRSGRRSAKSVLKLVDKGYEIIYDLQGGIIQWISDGNQIVK